MSQRKQYNLTDLVAQCDSAAPIPDELKDWDQAPSVGFEQTIMNGQVDIGDVILQFRERLADDYDVIQLILFGSRDPDPVLGPPRVGKIRLQLLLFSS
tara:strand:+ start:582 stop:875 length:294 start_codon:yes stop_codon:yes gene_type:complete